MGIFSLSCTYPFPRQRFGSGGWLLAALLLVTGATPVWAIPAPPAAVAAKSLPLQEDCSGTIRAFDRRPRGDVPSHLTEKNHMGEFPSRSFPEASFPIIVAGPLSAATPRGPANRVAQTSGAGAIAVIYPNIGEPYRSVFIQIIDGIEARAKGRVANFAVEPNVDIAELNNTLHRQATQVVVALGRQGMKVASALDSDIGVVVGGVLTGPENETRHLQVNSLSPDPALLFSRLKGIMPKVRRVFAVYDPRQNTWMMRLAKEAARAQGLELETYEVQDLRGAMHAYQKILAEADSRQDALWLPQDSTTVEDSSVLPLVLHESWAHNLAVFSSSFGHVKRGVLFSLYPNNVELGRHLAGSALSLLASGENEASVMLPLREVQMAVNLRTARHLGINASGQQGFDMTFPEQ
jgi:putative ABC transport system substrate-binding protein